MDSVFEEFKETLYVYKIMELWKVEHSSYVLIWYISYLSCISPGVKNMYLHAFNYI